jgi:hypothetical protein
MILRTALYRSSLTPLLSRLLRFGACSDFE